MRCGKLTVLALLLAAAAWTEAKWDDDEVAKRESRRVKMLLDSEEENEDSKFALRKDFEDWAEEHNKTYTGVEATVRFGQWKKSMKDIVNQNLDNDNSTWWSAPNEYSDLTWEEFKAGFLGADVTLAPSSGGGSGSGAPRKLLRQLLQTPPTSIDWVTKSKVTAIRNQNGCGACWAFASAAAIESMQLIKLNKTWDLSEQHFIDCVNVATGYQSNGCTGGWPTDALNYAFKYNQTTEAKYPFTNVTGTCKTAVITTTTSTQVVKIAATPGYTTITGLTATSLLTAVAAQPTIVAFNAESSFQTYAGGIYSAKSCSNTTVNHAMLVVGYNIGAGVGSSTAYWRLKNSWGKTWGESGFARVQMLGDGYGACAMYYYKYAPKF